MGDNARVRKIKARVKNFLDFNDAQLMKWWHTKNPSLGGATPAKLCETPLGLKKLEEKVSFSTSPLVPPEVKTSLRRRVFPTDQD